MTTESKNTILSESFQELFDLNNQLDIAVDLIEIEELQYKISCLKWDIYEGYGIEL